MAVLDLPLVIDAKREAENIERHIQKLLETNLAEGIVIGLSGGIDSAVLATLAVRAVGAEQFHAYYLYDRDSSKELQARAKLVADWLRIELKCQDITPTMRKMKIYSPLIMKITALSGFINRYLSAKPNRLLCAESPFMSTLRKGDFSGNKIKRFFYKNTVGSVEAAFNTRHIYRRKFLEQQAEEKNWLVLGAANRTELMVGWFVKGGIDDLPFSPIIGLYKTQVRQLAKYLGLPLEIQNQAPSPDMAKGITDESALGISYDNLDIILDYIDCGVSDQEIVSKGVSKKNLFLVRTMNNLSAWKRKPENPNLPAA
jgi:NAD+ synthase